MKIITSLLLCFLIGTASAQLISEFPATTTINPTDVFLIERPGVTNYTVTIGTIASNANPFITGSFFASNAVSFGQNLSVTNATSFGVFYRVANTTNMQFFNVKTGTNMVIYSDGSNIVLNSTGTGGGGSGDVSQADLANASNVVYVALVANDTTTSNGLFSVETTRNAAVSNSVVSLETTRNAAVSNSLASLLVANDTTTSNGLFSTETTRNAAVSNALVTLTLGTPRTNLAVYIALFDYGDLFVSTNLWVTNLITSLRHDTTDLNANNLVLTNALGSNQVRMGRQDLTNYSRNLFLVSGVGGANTNFTLTPNQEETVINAFTNVSVRAVMPISTTKVDYMRVTMTNGSGADTTLQFSPVTNDFRFAGVLGTNAPSLITNMTQFHADLRIVNTNVLVKYVYAPWP